MGKEELLSLYSDYLLYSTEQTTTTGLSQLLDGEISHDKILRLLSSESFDEKTLWNGVTTIELSRVIDEAIKQNLTGLYHLTPEKSINKYDLLLLIKKVFKCEIEIHPNDDFIVDKSLVNTRTDFNFIINSYSKQINEMLIWIKSHNDFYPYQFFSD